MDKITEQQLNDWLGEDNTLGKDIWERKYQHDGETLEEWFDRVSAGDKELRQLIKERKFLFGGRILSNRGLYKDGIKVTYSNCYVLPAPEDNIESIYDTASKLARTFSYGGGVGIDISNLAPNGARVNNTAKETSGAVSFIDLYNLTTGLIGQNGRRGALMISMSCDHPDIEDFIKLKTDLDKATKANLSIRVTDKFLTAVDQDSTYTLTFHREETGETITKEVKAREIFHKFCETNWDYAEPAFLFWDTIEKYNLLEKDENFHYAGTNPCLSGNTLIQTTDGNIPIKDLVGETPDVYCMDDDGNLTISKATKVWCTRKNAQTVTVSTGKGNIVCTPDHLIFTVNRGWVEAKSLKKGDKIKGLNRQMRGEAHLSVGLSGNKYVAEHRLVLGYYENIDKLDVHHIDGDTFNNKRDNLQALTHSEHSAITNTGRKIEINRDKNNGRFLPKKIKSKRKSKNQNKQVGNNWFVKSVCWNTTTEDVYDITVPEYHNFVANDMIVHNCAEEPLPAGGSCLLGSLNLSLFVDEDGKFNYQDFKRAIHIAVRGLNDVLDEGLPLHPLEIQRKTVKDWRQIGLGIMGLADMLIKMKLTYGSQESIDVCDTIGAFLAGEAIKASQNLAEETEPYPMWSDKVYDSEFFRKHSNTRKPLRNSQLLTIAPTGTLSTLLGISGGVEPVFANYYTRKTESLHGEDKYYKIFTKIAWDYLQEHGYGEDDSKLPEYFITSPEIHYTRRIRMQSIWQDHIDASISSTVNLPQSATVEDIEQLYMYAWKKGLKGITIFRDGCKRLGILTTQDDNHSTDETDEEEKFKIDDLRRGDILKVSDDLIGYKRKIVNGCGDFMEQIFFDEFSGEPMENYIAMGDNGGCEKNMEAISRLISLCWRSGVMVDEVVKQLKKVRTCPAYRTRHLIKGDTSKGTSCPSALGFAIEELCSKIHDRCFEDDYSDEDNDVDFAEIEYPSPANTMKAKCPECGAEIAFEGGCAVCHECGWSKCD